jgi:hypothetical protein
MITLTENEIAHLARNPRSLDVVMDYHDDQMCQADAMGVGDYAAHERRYEELKIERDRLREEWGLEVV